MANAEQLITENLDLWTTAVKAQTSAGRSSRKKPEIYGIAKLRGIILDLAVSGLLVQQDPEEEDAHTLLQRIKTEKSELISRKIIKKEKNNLPIDLHEVKNSLPKQWALCRLSDIATVIRGITFPASEKSNTPENGRIACLRTSNIQKEITWEDLLYIRERFTKREDQIILKDDIIMSMANSRELVGKVAIVKKTPEDKITFGGFLAVIRPIILEPGYLMAFLRSTNTRNKLIKSASQTTNIANISLGKLNPLLVPIPPLAEQYRIVAKVDELMAICDQLEEEQENNLETHETLASTLLNALTSAASDAAQFAYAWERIQDNFDILFTTESSIDQLKQAILQLAVMGKLVEQDAMDEPASILIKEIADDQARLVSKKKAKSGLIPKVPGREIPFSIPSSWSWERFQALPISYKTGLDRGKSEQGPDHLYRYFKMNNIMNNGGFDLSEITTVDASKEEEVKFNLQTGDLLFNTRNSQELVGKTCVFKEDGDGTVLYNNNILRARFSVEPVPYFLDLWMRSPAGKSELNKLKSGTTNVWAIYQGKLENLSCPLPPKEEQFRIIAKVDELMALCDQLKSILALSQNTQLSLADSIVEQAVHSPD